MTQLTELRARQAVLLAEARERLDQTEGADDGRRAELETQHDAAMAEWDRLEERAVRITSLEERERDFNGPGDDRRPGREDRSSREDRAATVQTPEELRGVFARMMQFGVEGLNEDERRAATSFRANLTPEMRAQTITTSGGGYIIPQGFQPEIIRSMADWGPMTDENVVRVLRTASGNPLPWPTMDDTSNTGVDHTINVADAEQDVVFGQKTLGANLASSGMIQVPLELLQDAAFDFDSLLTDIFGERLGRRLNTKLTTGTNGIVTGTTLGKTAASATALAADEIIDLFHSVNPAYRRSPKAGWQFNDATLKAIRKLKDGQGNYLWSMGDVKSGAPATLLEKPYFINQAVVDIATGVKPIIFGDHSKYVTRMVRDFVMLRLAERFADAFQVGFIAFARYDGALMDTAAVKHMIMA